MNLLAWTGRSKNRSRVWFCFSLFLIFTVQEIGFTSLASARETKLIRFLRDRAGDLPAPQATLRAIEILPQKIEKEGSWWARHLRRKTNELNHQGAFQAATYVNQNFEGETALLLAVKLQNFEVTEHLLALGANPDFPGYLGALTPLELTVARMNLPITELLLEYHADPLVLDSKFLTAAFRLGKLDMAWRLMQLGLKPERGWNGIISETNDGIDKTPLAIATQNRNLTLIHALIELGAKVTPQVLEIAQGSQSPLLFRLIRYYQDSKKTKEAFARGDLKELVKIKAGLMADLRELRAETSRNTSEVIDLLSNLNDSIVKRAHGIQNFIHTGRQDLDQSEEILPQSLSREKLSALHVDIEPSKTCHACLDPFPEGQEILPGPAGCRHSLCLDCSHQFVESELQGDRLHQSVCPSCKETAQLEFFDSLDLNPSTHDTIVLQQICGYYRKHASYLPCRGPNCPLGKVIQPGDSGNYTCLACHFSGCLKCGADPHGGGCEKSEESKTQIQALMKEAQKEGATLRPCYYCGKFVEKSDGCNAMDCHQCKKNFHWNYGEHLHHPRFEEWKTKTHQVHDDRMEEMNYVPLVEPHL